MEPVSRCLRRPALDPYHNARCLTGFEQDAAGVTAHFADGARARAGLLVAADGVRSLVRRTLLPGIEPQYAGYVAWRGLVDEAALSSRVLEDVLRSASRAM